MRNAERRHPQPFVSVGQRRRFVKRGRPRDSRPHITMHDGAQRSEGRERRRWSGFPPSQMCQRKKLGVGWKVIGHASHFLPQGLFVYHPFKFQRHWRGQKLIASALLPLVWMRDGFAIAVTKRPLLSRLLLRIGRSACRWAMQIFRRTTFAFKVI